MQDNVPLVTVVETPEFIKQAANCMDRQAKDTFIDFIAEDPLGGDLIKGTGGARKIRWSTGSNQGKRGGVRVIYYYHNKDIPIFLFTVYGKNKKSDITEKERKMLKAIIKELVETYYEDVNDE